MDSGTAAYYMNKDFMRISMKKWDLLLTRHDLQKAWKRAKSVKRNDPDFLKPKNKSKVPDLYR